MKPTWLNAGERLRQTDRVAVDEAQRTRLTELARDFPGLWADPKTTDLEHNEQQFQILLVNSSHFKGVEGLKTDRMPGRAFPVRVALEGSFIPPLEVRQLRDLKRLRVQLTQERNRFPNRTEKALEANLKVRRSSIRHLEGKRNEDLEGDHQRQAGPWLFADDAQGALREEGSACGIARRASTSARGGAGARTARVVL